MTPCKTQQRYTGVPCQGLEKGHDGDHNWPPLPKGDPKRRKLPASELPLDEKLLILADAMKADCEVFMLTALDNPALLDAAVDRARSDRRQTALKVFGWGGIL